MKATNSENKMIVKRNIAQILLEDKMFRLDFFGKLGSLSQISESEFQAHNAKLLKLEGYIKEYDNLKAEKIRKTKPKKDTPPWVANVKEIVARAKKDQEKLDGKEFVQNLKDLNSAIKATVNPKSEVDC